MIEKRLHSTQPFNLCINKDLYLTIIFCGHAENDAWLMEVFRLYRKQFNSFIYIHS